MHDRVHIQSVSANRLRVVRAERRVPQWRVARSARINPTRLWKIENDLTDPTPNERRRIASALGVAEADIWPDGACHDDPGTTARRDIATAGTRVSI